MAPSADPRHPAFAASSGQGPEHGSWVRTYISPHDASSLLVGVVTELVELSQRGGRVMDDEPRTEEERLEELRQSGEAIARLAAASEAFPEAVAAFRAAAAGRFPARLARPGLRGRCPPLCPA